MTRINTVPVSELTKRHLVAEYRELPMVLGSLRRSLKSSKGVDYSRIKEFTLNSGHVYFFYNKLTFLEKRYEALIAEMRNRGMAPNPDERDVEFKGFPDRCYQDWTPSDRDLAISRERIAIRINQKPHLYPDAKR